MGLIKAIAGSANGVMADQWKEFFYCESMPKDVLVTKGVHRTGKRSSNTKGTDNVITNGSVLAVADGQCMLIVEQGKVVDICAEPGEYIFDSMTAPSVFTGGLGAGILDTFRDIGKRFTFGGDKPSDQRIYYINTKEILENKFGTPNPIPFRVVDKNIGLDVDVSVRCSGVYSYKIVNPILFYTNVCGNVQGDYTRGEIDSQLKTEFISALQPAFAKWAQLRGIQVISIAMNPITLPPEDAEMIKQAQRTAVMRDPSMAAATLVGAQADAMKAAAENEAGAFTGFLGMGMAQQAGNAGNVNGLFQMGQQQQAQQYAQQQAQMQQPQQPQPTQTPQQSAGEDSWVCSCGTTNTSKFCTNCGNKKPENDGSWICSCGAKNFGKFCTECGSKKPEEKKTFRCDKCGWTPEDPASHPKFCPECGDIFDDNDIVK